MDRVHRKNMSVSINHIDERFFIKSANCPIFGTDLNGRIIEWNSKISDLSGFTWKDAHGLNLVDSFIGEQYQEKVRQWLRQAVLDSDSCQQNLKTEFVLSGNGIRSLLMNVTARKDLNGDVVGLLIIAQDVTDQSRSEQVVKAQAQELRQLVDQANAPIFGIDVNGKINEWNDRTALVTGYSQSEVTGKSLLHFIMPKLRHSVDEVLSVALRGDETTNYEMEFQTKSGEIRYFMVNISSRRDANSNIVGVIGIAQDVTETSEMEREIKATANELRQLVDTANAPIFGIDVFGNVNEWNDKTAEITGFAKVETFDKPLVTNFIVPHLQKSVQEVLDNALKGIETSNYELEFRTKYGETRYLLVNATTRRDANDEVIGVVGVAQDVTESRKHDREVAAMANELRQLVDNANAPIFGIDVEGNVNEWNTMTANITGYQRKEAFGKPLVSTFIVPEFRQSVQDVLDNALKGHETSNYELEFETKSGETRYLLVNATSRRDAENHIVGVVGVAQDVTETAKRDRAVTAMANELRQLVDNANAPIFGIDVHGNVNEWNDKTAEITGYYKEEAFNRPLVSTYIEPKLRQSVQEVMDNALQGNETSNYELEFRTKSGQTRYLLLNATTRRDPDGEIVGVVGVAQDVTETKKHDREVATMANELRQLVDNANAPIFGIDNEGNVNEWNAMTANITGYSKKEAFGKPLVSTFIVPKLRHSVQEVLDNALQGNETSNYELEFETKSGETRYLLVNATSRRDAENDIVGVVGVAQDVTETAKRDRAVTAMANELRQLVDNANAPIFGIDVHGNVNEWNAMTSNITGYSRKEAFGKPLVSTFIVPKLRHSVQEVLDNALKGNETSNYELEFETKSGETRYLLVNATTRCDAESNIVGVVGVAQDVTETAKRDRAVIAMANELRQLVDNANAPIFGIDIHGNVNEWNAKTAEITGYTKEEAFSKPLVSTFIVPKLRQSVQEVLDNALHGNETSNYELEFETKFGETRYLLVNATTRRDPADEIVGVVGVAQDVTESSNNERAIKAMANELRQLVDTANAPIFGIDIHGNVNEWNDKTAEITGYSKEEAFENPLVSTFIVKKLRESVQNVLDNALQGNETSNYELEFRTKSNEIRYLLVNATTRRNAHGNIVGVVGVAQDVTETWKRDQAVTAMANELRQLVDNANAPIFGIDVEGNVNEWNTMTANITGYKRKEAFGKPLVSTFIVPKLRQSVQEVLDNALQGNETSNYELEFETKFGETRYLLVNATTRRDAENDIVGVVGVAQDVTETAKRDRAVTAMANELRQLVDNANAPIFGIDVHGNVNEWNDKTAEITGYAKSEAFSKPLVSTFIVPILRQSVQEVLDNALQGNETSNYELEFRTKSGQTRYLLLNATTRRDPDGEIVGVVGVAQDVTESSKNEKAIKAMANELRQFVDTANAPIFGIDVDGNVNEWNDKTAEITEYDRKEAFNKPLVSTFIVKNLRESVQNVLDNALKGHETSNYELEFRTKSNEIRYLLVNATTRRDADGNIVGVVGVAQDVTETAKRDRAVSAMARELRQLVDDANAPIFGIDVHGNVNEWNAMTANITGYYSEEAFNKPLVKTFIVPKLQQSVQEVLDNALQGNETSNYELEFETKSGETRYLLVNATTRRDVENKIVGVVGVAQDVTETAKHDRAVAAMANELRQLVDTANAPIFGIDVNGNVNEWNDKTAEITGFSKEEALGKPLVSTFIVPKLKQSVQEVLDNALEDRGTSNYELEFVTKWGETRFLLVNATTRRDAESNIVGVVGVAQDVTEAAKHDKAVAAMANELRQLVDTANAPIFGIDVNGDVNEWNDKTAEITGFPREEAFGKPLVSTYIVPKLRQSVQEVLDNALQGVGTSNYDLEFRTKSNEIRYLLVNATTRRDADGNIVGVVGVAQDVTEAAKHDRAVAAMANELRQLVDTANAPIFGIDVNGDVNEWNNKTAEITGYNKEEAFAKPLVDTFIVPKLRESVQDVLDNALNGNETSNYELEFRTKSNEIRYLLVNATTRRDPESNIVGVVGVAQDVTEAAKHDRAVAAMARELRQLVDTANAPIFGIDMLGNVNEWNNKTAEITGFTKYEAMGKPLVSTYIVPSLGPSVQEILDNALHGNETSNYELEFETKSKEIRYLLVNATTRRDAESNIVGVVGVAQDVTDDRKHSQELRKMQYLQASQEAKVETERNMTAYFAHELRNPLHAIDSALNSMPNGLQEEAQSLVDSMQMCTAFMSSIMNNLLDVRKMEEGKMVLSSSPLSLTSLLDTVGKMLGPSVRPGVQFITECVVGSNDWVLGDSHRIQQIMTNVVTNAIKYTIKGYVKLSISWEGKCVKFVCEDTGSGIPKKEQQKLFERFVQRGGAPGTGLGLAIAKHLVDLTKGTIGFISDPTVKPGTSCVVSMPLRPCNPPEIVSMASEVRIDEKLCFLLIDDIAMNRTMLKRRLLKGIAPNSSIREAATGEEALKICSKESFDVIIVDQYMEEAGGVMVGTDVVFAMRRMRIDSIIIGCSGNDIDELFREAGADWVWGKPMPSNKSIIRQLRSAFMRKAPVKASKTKT